MEQKDMQDKVNLLNADCLDAMKGMADNSVDAIVTDPPYGLSFMGQKWDDFGGSSCGNDSMEVRKSKAQEYAQSHKGAPRYGNGHGGAPTMESMRSFQCAMTPIFIEALRVAKPGAHLLAFGGSRTYHRMACAIEDAGWEIRDCIMWVYGSGFPKSMDVSKAIDKKLGAERTKVRGVFGNTSFGLINDDSWKSHKDIDSDIPASPEAAKWNGYGTCLKPAYEPVIVARKPLDGTVSANVLKWGTGAINIDGCRVPTEDKISYTTGFCGKTDGWDRPWKHDEKRVNERNKRVADACDKANNLGRFPANLVHDGSDEVLACFPESKGALAPVYGKQGNQKCHTGDNGIYGHYEQRDTPMFPRGDSGSAARFFYCAKASREERGDGNVHPTVKPLALMRWLITMVTSEESVVLDPFMGSGTTGVAALQLGRKFIGVEREKEYYDIATKRISDEAEREYQPTLF